MASRYHDSSYNQRRMVAFAAIIAVHLFIAWAFISGFGMQVVHKVDTILQTTIIKQDQPKDLPPPPPKPEMDRPPPPSVPVPIINVNIPIEAPPIVVTRAPPPPRPVAIIAATPAKTVSLPDCHDEYYPSQELRQGHEGSAVVQICIGVNNKIDGPVALINSSGFPALDEAAGKCMSAGRYKAGSIDGKPARTCKNYKVTFKAKEAQ